MRVNPTEQSYVPRESLARQQLGWRGLLLVSLLVMLPVAATQTADEPVNGAEIADEYFPNDPRTEDFIPDDPDHLAPEDNGQPSVPNPQDPLDEHMNPIPPEAQPFQFSGELEVELPAGQSEIIQTFNLGDLVLRTGAGGAVGDSASPYGIAFFEFDLTVKADAYTGSEPLEVIIVLMQGRTAADVQNYIQLSGYGPSASSEGDLVPTEWELGVDGVSYYTAPTELLDEEAAQSSVTLGQNIFRDLRISEGSSSYAVTAATIETGYSWITSSAILGVILRRPTTCMMSVSYTGDLNGSDFGDVAYYNNFMKEGSRYYGGVAVATGTVADETAHELLGSLGLGGASVLSGHEAQAMEGAEVDPFAPDFVGPIPDTGPAPEQPPETQTQLTHFEKFATGAGEVPVNELETFGLTLMGRKVSPHISREQAFAQSVGAVSLGAATRSRTVFDGINTDAYARITLSRVTMVPNERFDDATAPQFMWLPGDSETYPEPAPVIEVYGIRPGQLGFWGRLSGDLTAKNYRLPNGDYAKIKVVAKFIANEGAFSCQPD
jgi:hypothetical protein